jgi:hypothetical protein
VKPKYCLIGVTVIALLWVSLDVFSNLGVKDSFVSISSSTNSKEAKDLWFSINKSPKKTTDSIEVISKEEQVNIAALKLSDSRSLGLMSISEISEKYEFYKLKKNNSKLVVNNETRLLLENMFRDVSTEEIEQSAHKIQTAAAFSLGEVVDEDDDKASKQFHQIVNNYIDYKKTIRSIDKDRNLRDLTPDDIVSEETDLQSLQEILFGKGVSEKLFGKQRALMLAMEKFQQQHVKSLESLELRDRKEMEVEYKKIVFE